VLDPDISAAEARRLLSSAPTDDLADQAGPGGWSRRTFLQAVGAGVFGGAALGTIASGFFGGDIPEAWAGAPLGPKDGILVLITMYGGNDGLNTLVPYANGSYYAKRANIAIPAEQVLRLDNQVGLHPELTYLKSLYAAGKMAVVQGVGYPQPDLSHFSSMGLWMGGRFGGGPMTSGWLGRWLDGLPGGTPDLAGVSVDTSTPLHMIGANRRGLAISPSGNMFGSSIRADQRRLYDGLRSLAATSGGRGPWHDAFATTMKRQLDLAVDVTPAFTAKFPGGTVARKLTVAARLINLDIGLRVIDVGFDGFDNHENEPGRHAGLLRDLNTGLQWFFATLAPELQSRVTLATVSEFGRTPASNDSSGTDHGTAAAHFVIGAGVKGGMYGAAPSLDVLDRNKRLIHTVDFRSVYGSLLDGWLGGGGSSIVNGSFENLGLFATGPGDPPVGAPLPIVVGAGPSEKSGFVPLAPVRVFDTRDGGGELAPLGPSEWYSFSFKDRFGVPADAVAVALNLTTVGATAPSFITVWPAGDTRPFTANLNPVPGLAVPNLVVARLSTGGAISLYNNSGRVDLIGDLVGYFKPSSTTRLQPLTPARLLDTRDGTGVAAPGTLGQGKSIDLLVAGRGGVSSDASAVALNITVTEPTASSYLTVWPTGSPMPLAASINMEPGQTVPNLVIAQVGAGGKVSIFNFAGSTHVVADVLGSFGPSGSSRYVAFAPVRVLDTRDGTGAPVAPVGQTPLVLKLAGVKGIPSSGVGAVLLNVTMVRPTATTYLTVYPSGTDRPLAANLYATPGQVVPNMVLGALGADGSVTVFNFAGTTDLVADVMGYFAT
jgi:uncharacterized protein (DUF1501 family)